MKYTHVFVIGGTGFLGYHTSLELAARGVQVTALAMPQESVSPELTAQIAVQKADIDALDDSELSKILMGHEALIYAAGPDDRIELQPGTRAKDFFGAQLVNRTTRVVKIAKAAGIKKVVIFGSYFAYINNRGLCGIAQGGLEHHPYIAARVAQTNQAFALGDDGFSVSVLNIPYVFGTAPGKEPIWRNVFVERFAASPKIYYGKGGTTVISAKKIAVCAVQALEVAEHKDELPVGSVNMKFTPMITQLLKAADIDKPVAEIPTWLQGIFMKNEWKKMQRKSLDSGLDLRYLARDILGRDFYVDFEATDKKLQMSEYVDTVDAAIEETGRLIRQLQRD